MVSAAHLEALDQMLGEFAGYLTGGVSGRRAYSLPTGMGKTTAVVALLTALFQLGHTVPVSVAASRVEALISIREGLLAQGVPAALIGLKHSLGDAAVASTGDTEHLFQLVTHARVRGGTDLALFGEYRGNPRPLLLYDETLWRSETTSIFTADARSALAWTKPQQSPAHLASYFSRWDAEIAAAVEQSAKLPQGAPLELSSMEDAELRAAEVWLQQSGWPVADDLIALLSLSGEFLRLVNTEQGTGLISIRQAVPSALKDVAILDASAQIRELSKLDRSIHVVENVGPAPLKSFSDVEIFQYVAGGGRSTLKKRSFGVKPRDAALAKEVASMISRDLTDDPARTFLIFTFKARGNDDPAQDLRRGLRNAGIDTASSTEEGLPRFEFLTWGQHEGLNGYERHKSVILAGVLQRDHLSLSAAIKGQSNDPAKPVPGDLVRRMLETEVVHCVYQAASRGSCRRVNNGKAQLTRLHVIHKHERLKAALDVVMPQARWHYPDLLHLPRAIATGKQISMLEQLIVYLNTVPPETQQLSTRRVKRAMSLGGDVATRNRFTAAAGRLASAGTGWALEDRSVIRTAKTAA